MVNNDNNLQGDEILARPDLVHKIWQALKYSNVMLVGPPGIGKTFILQYLKNHCPEGFRPKYFSGNYGSLQSLREEMIQSYSDSFIKPSRLSSLGFSSKNRSFGRGPTLSEIVSKVVDSLEPEVSLLLILDDFTDLLVQSDELEGRKLMDELRYIRMQHDRVKMILAGRNVEELGHSYGDIGFFNDLTVLSVGPLSEKNTQEIIKQSINQLNLFPEISMGKKFFQFMFNISAGSPLLLQVALKALTSIADFSDEGYSEKKLELGIESNTAKTLNKLIENIWCKAESRLTDEEGQEVEHILNKLVISGSRIIEYELDEPNKRNYRGIRVLVQEGFLSREDGFISFTHKAFRDWWKSRKPESKPNNKKRLSRN